MSIDLPIRTTVVSLYCVTRWPDIAIMVRTKGGLHKQIALPSANFPGYPESFTCEDGIEFRFEWGETGEGRRTLKVILGEEFFVAEQHPTEPHLWCDTPMATHEGPNRHRRFVTKVA